jgi:MoaA/NifB/PqqE/SkfB family radical SAM enzyme
VSTEQNNFSCSENIPKAVVVGSDGSLSACVINQVPVRGDNYYYVKRQKHLQKNLSFGNIQKESLNTIWRRKECQLLIREFRNGKGPVVCENCLKKTN